MKLLSGCLRQAVHWLQHDANETYEQEGRIKINTNINGASATITSYIFRPPPINPSQRMFSDVVQDSKLTFRIHALFVWLLRIASSAIKETLFDGLPTEEQTTKQERKGKQKILSDSFLLPVLLLLLDVLDDENLTSSMIKRRRTTMVSKSVTNGNQNSLAISSTLRNDSENASFLATSLYSSIDGYHHLDGGSGNEDSDSSQYHYSCNSHEAFKLYESFIKKLDNTKHLQYILYNWVIGNRLIIKYTNRTDNKYLSRTLASVFRVKYLKLNTRHKNKCLFVFFSIAIFT